MSTRIRLQRHGKKRYAYYHIVVADSRSKRDGKSIERIGDYNPNTDPATINLDFDRAIHWLQVGAQPSDTARAILSYKGAMYKNHLLNGVKKGAHTEEEVQSKYDAWIADKESRIQAKRDSLKQASESATKERIATEAKIKEARAEEIRAKQTPLAEEGAATTEAAPTEAAPVEAAAEGAAATTEVPTEAAPVEAPVEEAAATEEAPKEEPKKEEAPKEEVKEEAPKEEAKAEEKPADDLTKVEGIGPKIAEALVAGGVSTFAVLAEKSADDIKGMISEVAGSHVPDTWPKQAQMAADGKWDELKKWQDELDGGKPAEEAKAEEAPKEEAKSEEEE